MGTEGVTHRIRESTRVESRDLQPEAAGGLAVSSLGPWGPSRPAPPFSVRLWLLGVWTLVCLEYRCASSGRLFIRFFTNNISNGTKNLPGSPVERPILLKSLLFDQRR